MATLNQFKAFMKDGMAITSHFMVALTIPKILVGRNALYSSNMNKIRAFCDQASLPSISYSTNQVRSYGEYREVPYEKIFGQINLSFYVDGPMYVKAFFDDWIDAIQNKVTRDFSYSDDYMVDTIPVIVKDASETSRYSMILNRCYPKSVNPITLDYAGKNVMKLNVDMIYQFATWENLGISRAGGIEPSVSQQVIDSFVQTGNSIPPGYFSNQRELDRDTTLNTADRTNESVGRGDVQVERN